MARNFASGDLFTVSSDAAYDIAVGTLAFWMRTSQAAGFTHLFSRHNVFASRSGFTCITSSSTASLFVVTIKNQSGVVLDLTGTIANLKDGNWHYCLLEFRQASGATCLIDVDGVQEDSGVTTQAWAFNNQILRLGIGIDTFWGEFLGDMAELTLWDSALSVGERKALASGVLSYRIRPENIVDYWPLGGYLSPEPSYSGTGRDGILTGTSKSNHAPVSLPTPKWAANAPIIGATVSLPPFRNYMQPLLVR